MVTRPLSRRMWCRFVSSNPTARCTNVVNRGTATHEFGLARFKPGVTAKQLVDLVNRGEDPNPLVPAGENTTVEFEPEPGTVYGYACYQTDADGQPHFAHGMWGVLEVES